jgi:hypothetical protein
VTAVPSVAALHDVGDAFGVATMVSRATAAQYAEPSYATARTPFVPPGSVALVHEPVPLRTALFAAVVRSTPALA